MPGDRSRRNRRHPPLSGAQLKYSERACNFGHHKREVSMLITPIHPDHEPLLFTESIPAGSLDYAPDVQQSGPLPVTGRADLLLENRGHNDIVNDIRLRASYTGALEVLCARCVEPLPMPIEGEFDLI